MADELTHLDDSGHVHMVDVSAKSRTVRVARAFARVSCRPETLRAVRDGNVPKGDVLAVARVAAITGAKRTPDLIPLCHPVALTGVEVETTLGDSCIEITTTATAADRTGVEMEALTAAAAAALTLYDMLKAIEKGIVISELRLLRKEGGRSGTWTAEDGRS